MSLLLYAIFGLVVCVCPINGDFVLACQKGYRISGIKRVNSIYQRRTVGSFTIECQPIQERNLNEVKCETWTSAPQCNGAFEGCTGSQWLAGFQAYLIENNTNAILLDPICCSSSSIRVDSFSCASERLNVALKPFDHSILENDLIYRSVEECNAGINTIAITL
uniref:Uncharacterized protein n=1 Tax=Acrobeloides nanus TaxID=290746 RepID=A0A914DEI2_9BILA